MVFAAWSRSLWTKSKETKLLSKLSLRSSAACPQVVAGDEAVASEAAGQANAIKKD